jgi:CcmD family protein
MSLIKTGALLSCIFLLLVTAGAGIPFNAGREQSITMLVNTDLHAQEIQKAGQDATLDTEKRPEPSTALYQVMGVVLIIWIGLAFFLFRIDRKVTKLENQVKIRQ